MNCFTAKSSITRCKAPLLLATAITCLAAGTSSAQNLVVTLLNGEEHQLSTNDIESIKFVANSMAIYQNDGGVVWWDIAEIANYKFDLSALHNADSDAEDGKALRIFPNPARKRASIEYSDA